MKELRESDFRLEYGIYSLLSSGIVSPVDLPIELLEFIKGQVDLIE